MDGKTIPKVRMYKTLPKISLEEQPEAKADGRMDSRFNSVARE